MCSANPRTTQHQWRGTTSCRLCRHPCTRSRIWPLGSAGAWEGWTWRNGTRVICRISGPAVQPAVSVNVGVPRTCERRQRARGQSPCALGTHGMQQLLTLIRLRMRQLRPRWLIILLIDCGMNDRTQSQLIRLPRELEACGRAAQTLWRTEFPLTPALSPE